MEYIEKIIDKFNENFGAKCKLIDVDKDRITVLFSGNICYTCGTYDYFEDLAIYLSKYMNVEYGVESYKQLDNGEYIVNYLPKEKIKETKRDIRFIIYE